MLQEEGGNLAALGSWACKVISKPDQIAMDSHKGPETKEQVEADTNFTNETNEGNATNEYSNIPEAITRI